MFPVKKDGGVESVRWSCEEGSFGFASHIAHVSSEEGNFLFVSHIVGGTIDEGTHIL